MDYKEYNAKNITVLEGLDAVKKRPGMYVGDITQAVLQMVFEVIDNCIDEHSIGFCSEIDFNFSNNVFSIRDNGRGIPVDMHESGVPAVEIILTTLHSGGKFNEDSYQYSGGLHGVGISVVNALAKWLEVEVYRNNKIYFIRFDHGKTSVNLEERGYTDLKGTKISFEPDLDLIESKMPTSQEIEKRLKELSYLNKSLVINYKFENTSKVFSAVGGILDLAKTIGNSNDSHIFHFASQAIDTAFFWDNDYEEQIMCFTNNIFQIDGGTHLVGLRNSIVKTLMPYCEEESKKIKIIGEDIRKGLKGVISIKINEPKFSSQTKNKLVSNEVREMVDSFIFPLLKEWFEQNPNTRKKIIQKIINAADLRERINNEKESIKKSTIETWSLPGKLADCQSDDPAQSEIYIVEGDSAGGSAKMGRDRKYQAVLALRGKPLNAERAHFNKLLNSEVIGTIIASLGTGIGQHFDLTKLRYHKIIIMTDADVDGSHILCLLITFFLKMMPQLVLNGNIYVAKTPLFKVSSGRNHKYIQDEDELKSYLLERFCQNNIVQDCHGNSLSLDGIANLISESLDFRQFIEKKSLTTDEKILSLSLVYDIFNNKDECLKILGEVIDGEISLISEEKGFKININSLYGKTSFFVKNNNISWKMPLFPILLNDEKIYEPLEFLRQVEKKSNSGIMVQRYKGLGEMNPEELRETSLIPEKRKIENLIIDGSLEDTIEHMQTVMGNQNNRRDFVLGYIQKVFGIYL